MSTNLWVEFDTKIAALGTKAVELEEMKGKLQNIPARLAIVKEQIIKLKESAQGIASESVRTEIQKDIRTKVEKLDNIFKKLESTKTSGDPILAKLETALGDLENYTTVAPDTYRDVSRRYVSNSSGSNSSASTSSAMTSSGSTSSGSNSSASAVKNAKTAWKVGGYFSHKKYSKKRNMKKQHKSKKHKKATKSRKVHKLKKNKSRRYRR